MFSEIRISKDVGRGRCQRALAASHPRLLYPLGSPEQLANIRNASSNAPQNKDTTNPTRHGDSVQNTTSYLGV